MAKAEKNYPEIDNIKEDIDSLKENTIELTKHVKKDGAAKTAELKAIASDNLEGLAKTGKEKLKTVEKQVKANPLKSLAVAFVAGAILSSFIGRR